MRFSWSLPSGEAPLYLAIGNNRDFDGCLETASGPPFESSRGRARFIHLGASQTSVVLKLTPMRLYYWTVVYFIRGLPYSTGCGAINDLSLPIRTLRTYGPISKGLAEVIFADAATVYQRTPRIGFPPFAGGGKVSCRRGGSSRWRCRYTEAYSSPHVAMGTLRIVGTRARWHRREVERRPLDTTSFSRSGCPAGRGHVRARLCDPRRNGISRPLGLASAC